MSAPAGATTPDTAAASTAKATTKPAATTKAPVATTKTATVQDTPTKAGAQDTSKKGAAAQDTSKKAAAAKPSGAGGGGTPQQIALGDSIFHGQVGGGTCSACHGQDAKGTAVAPDLTDSQWLNGDGSYQFLVNTITNGVPQPKQHPAPMPPKGGAPLTDDQVKAVAAYEYSLSHKT
jgi:mono/diheme cytochrome c family protein